MESSNGLFADFGWLPALLCGGNGKTPKGKVLHNRVCTGTYEYNKFNSQTGQQRPREEWIAIMVDPIISEDDFEKASQILDTRTVAQKEERIYRGPLLFTGLLKCGLCDTQLVSAGTKNNDKVFRYYTCKKYMKSGKESCPGVRARVDVFEPLVLDAVMNWILSMENVLPVVQALQKALKERSKPLQKLKVRIEEVQMALARYQEGFESGAFTINDVAERFRELAAQKRALEEEYARKSTVKTFPAELAQTENVTRVREQLKEAFGKATSHVKKLYLHMLIDYIVFDGKRVEIKARNDGIIAVLDSLEALENGDVATIKSQLKNWQPLGDSNPCDGTENPASSTAR